MASYPRQIPAGGEGTVSIKVNTSGYGGRDLKKHIEVFTNDPAAPRITFAITGKVLNFARVEPAYARLVGVAGSDIKKTVTIFQEKGYPFKITDAKARNGANITFDLKEFSNASGEGYTLTIENRKTDAGRYADTVILTTDSTIKPTINVPVYGQIAAMAPENTTPPPKGASGG